MNTLYLLMMSGLLMGSIAVTINGTAYPTMPYQNPMAFVSGMMNREASMQDANKAVLKENSAEETMNETSLIAGIDILNEKEFHEKNWSMKALSDWVGVFRYVEVYG